MMILDSNIIIKCFRNKKALPKDDFVAPDDLRDEYLVAQQMHGEDIPGVKLFSKLPSYDEAHYLQRYAHYLNSYSEVYFAQMRGLADVSILAMVSCLITNFGRQGQQMVFDLGIDDPEVITVATDDDSLTRSLKQEFGDKIRTIGYDDF